MKASPWLWKRLHRAVHRLAVRPAHAAIAVLLALSAGCAGIAPAGDGEPAAQAVADLDWFALFPDASDLYFLARPVPEVRALSARLLEDRRIRSVLRRTETVWGAVLFSAPPSPPSPPSPPRVYLAAPGRYRRGLLGCGLSLSRDWRRVAPDTWRAREGEAEIHLSGRNLVLAATVGLSPVMDRRREGRFAAPAAVADAAAGADLLVYFPTFRQELYRPITRVALPLDSGWLHAQVRDGRFHLEAVFLLDDPRGGRLFTVGLKLLITHFLRLAKVPDLGDRLGRIEVVPDGGRVDMRGLVLDPEELEALFARLKEA